MAHLTRRGLTLTLLPTTAWRITHGSAHRTPTFSKLALKAATSSTTTTLQPPNRHKTTHTKINTNAPNLTPETKQPPHPLTLLQTQRLHRPLSPHLAIYRPQITSVLSVLMRNTGLLLSGAFYLFPLLYLASPYLFLDLSSASLAASFAGLSGVSRALVKGAVAWVGLFHGLNSLRVVTWGFARGLGVGTVWWSGWGVVLASVAGAGGLVWWV